MSYVIKTKPGCIYCDMSKNVLAETGETVTEQVYSTGVDIANFKSEGYKTFPQIFHNGKHIGGYEELVRYLNEAEEF